MRSFISLITVLALFSFSAFAQDLHDWQQATDRLHPADRLHLSLRTGPVDAIFISSTAEDLTADSGTMRKADILKIERLKSKRHSGRAKRALIGAGIGAAAGIAILFGLHFNNTVGAASAISGGVWGGALIGSAVGALLPAGDAKQETIYSVPR